jgi:zinc protease
MKKILSSIVLVVALSFTAHADEEYQKITEKTLFNGDTLQEFRLKNGLRVLLVPRHQAKLITYQTWFQVGSLDEKLDPKLKKTGLAHLFEHMMFRGSEKYPDGEFDKISSRIGSDKQNATTYFYRTNYYQSIPSTQLDTLMELEADRMSSLKLDGPTLEKEKGAVVGELRRALDNPNRLAWDEICKLTHEVLPFRYTVLGTEEEIKGFSLEEAQYFYKTFYAPNNATLIVVGDVTEKTLLPKVVKYYGPMKSQTLPTVAALEEPPQKKERRVERTHQQATSEILLVAYKIPDVGSDDIAPLSLMSTHLSTGMEARLRKVLVDTGIAVGAGAEISNKPDFLEFSVHLAEKRKAEEALKILDREIETLKKAPIKAASFERALNQELLGLYSSVSDNSTLATVLGDYLMLSGNYMRGLEIIESYKKLKPIDINRVAKQYLKKDQRSIVIVRPAPKTVSRKEEVPS